MQRPDSSRVDFDMCLAHESTLAKKHNTINYHTICEAVAAGIIRVAKDPTETKMDNRQEAEEGRGSAGGGDGIRVLGHGGPG